MRGPRPTAPHGTAAAARRHYRHGEKPCEPCRVAMNLADVERRGGGDPYARSTMPGPQPAPRNGLPIVAYNWQARTYSWAAEQIRRAEAIYGAPEKDDGAAWDREAG
jgi:hypothetical protein